MDRYGGRVFSDEIHAPLVFAGARHVPYASLSPVTAEHTLTATSASKAWNLPGLKCAQVVLSNDADRDTWAGIGPLAEHGAATLGVIANTAAYENGGPWLADGAVLPGRQPAAARHAGRRPAARGDLHAAGGDLPGLAGLPAHRAGRPGAVLPGRRRGWR